MCGLRELLDTSGSGTNAFSAASVVRFVDVRLWQGLLDLVLIAST